MNSPPVALETVDEETIIVNLDTGSYYDLDPVGTHVLVTLERGGDAAAAVAAVAGRWDVAPDVAGPAVHRLVEELAAEAIIVPAERVPADDGDAADEPPARPYSEPRLGKYTDMQELLLLDPVHEVDAAGWPGRA